jgi:hypothetical protein
MKKLKKCYICKKDLPLSDFWDSTYHGDGKQPHCIPCGKEYYKAYMAKYRETPGHQAYRQQYYIENRKTIRQQQKRYYLNNKGKIQKKKSEWCGNNKDRIGDYNREYYQKNRERISKQRKAARAAL